jgi:hypothetical protein
MQMHRNKACSPLAATLPVPFGPFLETALTRVLGTRPFVSGANSDLHGEEPRSLCGLSNQEAHTTGRGISALINPFLTIHRAKIAELRS